MNNYDQIKELVIDEWIWVIFIILSVLNIFGDEFEKDFYQENDNFKDQNAKNIFTFTVFISFLIYCYILYQRYNKTKLFHLQNKDTTICDFRCLGSILVVIASIIFLCCQLKEKNASNPSLV